MRQPKFKNINVTCPHDCPDTCSLVVTVDKSSGKAVKLKGNDKHPITKGFLCNKVNHYLDLVYNKNRVLYPHVRIGPKGSKGKFKKVEITGGNQNTLYGEIDQKLNENNFAA